MANLTEEEREALRDISYTEELSDTSKALLFMAFIYTPILYLIVRG